MVKSWKKAVNFQINFYSFSVFTLSEILSVVELPRMRKVSACLIPASLAGKESSSDEPSAGKGVGVRTAGAYFQDVGFQLANELADAAGKPLRGRK